MFKDRVEGEHWEGDLITGTMNQSAIGTLVERSSRFTILAGLVVMQQMLTEKLTAIVGAKHAKLGGERVGNRYGTATGQVALGSTEDHR